MPRDRSKDIEQYDYFRGSISRGLWRFILYRFTRASGWMLLVTLLFVSYASNTLEIQAYTPVAYLLCIWLVALAAALVSRPRIRVRARHGDRIRVGDTLPVEIELTQVRRWRQELNIVAHRLPPSIDAAAPDGLRVRPLGFGESVRLTMGLVCRERGAHSWR
ncbi:MAG TPA: hypothetical protein VKT77_06550, partial [Chthonomonadaceae bacterium]|nr:hypothetical protein [Chthonomonadaceae bacterium]